MELSAKETEARLSGEHKVIELMDALEEAVNKARQSRRDIVSAHEQDGVNDASSAA